MLAKENSELQAALQSTQAVDEKTLLDLLRGKLKDLEAARDKQVG